MFYIDHIIIETRPFNPLKFIIYFIEFCYIRAFRLNNYVFRKKSKLFMLKGDSNPNVKHVLYERGPISVEKWGSCGYLKILI